MENQGQDNTLQGADAADAADTPAKADNSTKEPAKLEKAVSQSGPPPQPPPQHEDRPPADHPLLLAIKALLDLLGGEPKHSRLDSLWQKCRAEYDKVTGGPAPSGRIAGDEHPSFRNGADTDASLAGDHNTGSSNSQSRFDY